MAKLCCLAADKLGLSALAKLIGLTHDFGKATADLQSYLRGDGSKHPNHAGLGALYAKRHWWTSEKTWAERQTAQLISLCIYGHHAGLPDCLNESGRSPYLDGLQEQPDDYYLEAMANFYEEVASAEELDALFADACKELEQFPIAKSSFEWGILARLLLSILVDADRWDSACFEYDGAGLRENLARESIRCQFPPEAERPIPVCGLRLPRLKRMDSGEFSILSP